MFKKQAHDNQIIYKFQIFAINLKESHLLSLCCNYNMFHIKNLFGIFHHPCKKNHIQFNHRIIHSHQHRFTAFQVRKSPQSFKEKLLSLNLCHYDQLFISTTYFSFIFKTTTTWAYHQHRRRWRDDGTEIIC